MILECIYDAMQTKQCDRIQCITKGQNEVQHITAISSPVFKHATLQIRTYNGIPTTCSMIHECKLRHAYKQHRDVRARIPCGEELEGFGLCRNIFEHWFVKDAGTHLFVKVQRKSTMIFGFNVGWNRLGEQGKTLVRYIPILKQAQAQFSPW